MHGNLGPKGAFKNPGKREGCLSIATMLHDHRTVNNDGTVNAGNNREILQLTGLKRSKK